MANDNRYCSPFTEPSADIIFCSLDKVYFKLHKIILSLASDFFKSMLSLPQPTIDAVDPCCAPDVDGIPVVYVTEPGDVLESLFCLCYPIPDPPLNTLALVRSTLEAAIKYEMREAIDLATHRLQDFADTVPLSVYAIACRLSLTNVIPVAARAVLRKKAKDNYADELEEIPVDAYHRLLVYCDGGDVQWACSLSTTDGGNRSGNLAARRAALIASELPKGTAFAPTPRSDEVVVPSAFDINHAEVIIRSSDGVRFGVGKETLRLSSTVLFEQSIASIACLDSTPPILDVSEPSRVVLTLLSLYHPDLYPDLDDLRGIVAALLAAEKYRMKKAIWHLCKALQALGHNPSVDPISLYFAACRFRIVDLARVAAHRTLRRDLIKELSPEVNIPDLPAACLWRLLEYHRRCRSAVRALFDGNRGKPACVPEEWTTKLAQNCSRSSSSPICCGLESYLCAIGKEAWPNNASPRSEEALTALALGSNPPPYQHDRRCTECRGPKGSSIMLSFSRYVEDTIDERESKVELPWSAA
ncbi:hypothetical protein GY45DRAFT_959768 [Cubamyces sp. BRFM 1775]|nr:hypothetical protein GY45DRAFT_959768 [Cubamyces sp. BRFM 1775]